MILSVDVVQLPSALTVSPKLIIGLLSPTEIDIMTVKMLNDHYKAWIECLLILPW